MSLSNISAPQRLCVSLSFLRRLLDDLDFVGGQAIEFIDEPIDLPCDGVWKCGHAITLTLRITSGNGEQGGRAGGRGSGVREAEGGRGLALPMASVAECVCPLAE